MHSFICHLRVIIQLSLIFFPLKECHLFLWRTKRTRLMSFWQDFWIRQRNLTLFGQILVFPCNNDVKIRKQRLLNTCWLVGLSVKPVEGSALYWFNIGSNMHYDSRVLHLGCPVMYGNKWIANKWIKILPQFRNYPCSEGKKYYSIIT